MLQRSILFLQTVHGGLQFGEFLVQIDIVDDIRDLEKVFEVVDHSHSSLLGAAFDFECYAVQMDKAKILAAAKSEFAKTLVEHVCP
jgi:hypothetical protein